MQWEQLHGSPPDLNSRVAGFQGLMDEGRRKAARALKELADGIERVPNGNLLVRCRTPGKLFSVNSH
jgi:hypothetical protein